MSEYEKVEGMSVGQVVDAALNGGSFIITNKILTFVLTLKESIYFHLTIG